MRYIIILLVSLSLGCSTQHMMTSIDDAGSKKMILFRVGDTPVSTEEFVYVYKKNNVNNDSAYTQADIEEYLDLYVKFKLKIQEAKSLGMDTTQAFINEFNSYKEQLKKPYLTETQVTDSLVREAYNRMKREVKASHILVKLDEKAIPEDTLKAYNRIIEIRSKAINGGDFVTLAKEYSDDPSAKTNGGDLGYFTAFQMVYPFENMAFNTPKGEVSAPVRTKFGYHIIKVLDSRPSQGTVEVSHIMLRVKQDNNDSLKVRDKIFEIHEQAIAGVPWEDLASQFSEDINTKDKGGRLRPFGVGQMPFAFQEAAFGLAKEGSISDPFKTPYGWHIVRLEKRDPIKSFEEIESTLKSRINRDTRAKVNKTVVINRLKSENQFVQVTEITSLIPTYFDSTLIVGNWLKPELSDVKNVVLFKIGDSKYHLDDFMDFVGQRQKKNSYTLNEYVNLLYTDFESEEVMAYEDSRLEEKYIDYRMLVQEYREGILLFQLMEEKVWSKAVKDTIGLERFFEENKSKYQWEERVKATIYNAADIEIIKELQSSLARGEDLDQNALDSLYNKDSSIAIQITKGDYQKGDHPIIDMTGREVGIYEVPENGRFNLVVIEEVQPAGPKKLNETRGLVISDYQDVLEKEWIEQLKSRHTVEMNDSSIKSMYETLL